MQYENSRKVQGILSDIIEKIECLSYEYRDELEKIKRLKCNLILFGAGATSEFIVKQFKSIGIQPTFFCDNDRKKVGMELAGIFVIDLEEVKKMNNKYIYITTQLHYNDIKNQLLQEGISKDEISDYDLIFQFSWEKECIEYYMKVRNDIEFVYHSLADEKSREVLFARMAFLKTRNRNYMLNVRSEQQYFDQDILRNQDIYCFVDVGTYTGDTIREFIEIYGTNNIIIGFEPDEKLYQTAQKETYQFDNIKIYQVALSNKKGKVAINVILGNMNTLEEDVFYKDKETPPTDKKFLTNTLDFVLENRTDKVDFIKMDVEGTEVLALMGAENIIKEDRPVAAICIYHKKEDIITVAHYFTEIDKSVKLYLRHYSDNQTETVLYAVFDRR